MKAQSEFKTAWDDVEVQAQRLYDTALHETQLPLLDELFKKMGPIGRHFLMEFSASQCHETVDRFIRNTSTNAMGPTYHYGSSRFCNELSYNPGILNSLRWMFRAKSHDGIHAIQWASSAALHANSWNKKTQFILSPRSDMLKLELTENDAYAKQLLLEQVLGNVECWDDAVDNVKGEDTRSQILSVMTDGTLKLDDVAVQRLQHYASSVLDSEKRADKKSFREAYRDVCLKDWKNGLDLRRSDGNMRDVEFVTLDEEDVMILGSSLGIYTFGKEPIETRAWLNGTLDLDCEQRIQEINEKAGIDEKSLRTLGQALASCGMSKNEYLTKQRGCFGAMTASPPPAVQLPAHGVGGFMPHIASGASTSHPSRAPA